MLHNDVVENLLTGRKYRRARRHRKRRYRQASFNNRVHSKHKGWLAPSVEVKIQEHVTAIKRVFKILPISKVVVETAEFDLQLIKAVEASLPVPVGEDYQKGEECHAKLHEGKVLLPGGGKRKRGFTGMLLSWVLCVRL